MRERKWKMLTTAGVVVSCTCPTRLYVPSSDSSNPESEGLAKPVSLISSLAPGSKLFHWLCPKSRLRDAFSMKMCDCKGVSFVKSIILRVAVYYG
jgi:hypothetical protein